MKLNNTTDIPDALILLAVRHAIEEGVSIDEIVVRNKKEGHFDGQWGWYFPHQRKVVLIVPREISRTKVFRLRHLGVACYFASRVEFVVAVMAHELRHGWQHQVDKRLVGHGSIWKRLREVDAEKYELAMLKSWRVKMDMIQKAAAHSNVSV